MYWLCTLANKISWNGQTNCWGKYIDISSITINIAKCCPDIWGLSRKKLSYSIYNYRLSGHDANYGSSLLLPLYLSSAVDIVFYEIKLNGLCYCIWNQILQLRLQIWWLQSSCVAVRCWFSLYYFLVLFLFSPFIGNSTTFTINIF